MENENSVEKLVERMEQSLKKKEEEKQEQVKLNKVEQNEIEPSKLKQTKNYGKTKKEKLKIKREKMKEKAIEKQERKTPKSFSNSNKKEIKYISQEPDMDDDLEENDDNNVVYHIGYDGVTFRVNDSDEKEKLIIIAD